MSELPVVTVVIRTKDEAESIGRNLELVAGQTIGERTQIVVVDSGSRDETVAIVRAAGVEVVEIPAAAFTYGYSLNVGTERAEADLVVALSAHAFPLDERWLERMVATFEDPRVACACGYEGDPEGRPLTSPHVQDEEDARRHPLYGYSNAAGGFRAELWRQRRFREEMPGVEDKEWAWYWMRRGYVSIVDPALMVDHDHTDENVGEKYRRWRREWLGLGYFVELPPYSFREVLREWWTEQAGRRSMTRARLSPNRLAELAGTYVGRRQAVRLIERDDLDPETKLVPAGPLEPRVPELQD
jgi:rhamnosyltransferase